MAVPRQMTAHSLDAKKGWPSPHAVDFSAKFATSGTNGLVDGYVAFAGSLVSLDASGNFVYGCASAAMPMWLLQNSDDPDVENPGGTLLTGASGTSGAWSAVAPTGVITALPAVGAYELATTEFTGTGYAPNDPIKGDANSVDGDHADRGKLDEYAWAAGHAGTQADIVGICSRAEANNSHGVSEVSFWPVYLPLSKLSTATS